MYVQYGCGLSAPQEWENFDVSPTLKIQKVPMVGKFLTPVLNVKFPGNVKYGDIIHGLPGIMSNSCDGVYCSHVLEHLAFNEFHKALNNTFRILKPGGLFRLVMPDLEISVRNYLQDLEDGKSDAAIKFMRNTGMALEYREKGLRAMAIGAYGNARHQWLWDYPATINALQNAGFQRIRKCAFNDSADNMFNLVEDKERFKGAVCIEAIK
jgi:SAM-dependent methyltransferase